MKNSFLGIIGAADVNMFSYLRGLPLGRLFYNATYWFLHLLRMQAAKHISANCALQYVASQTKICHIWHSKC